MVPSEQFAWMAQRRARDQSDASSSPARFERRGWSASVYAGGVASNIQANLKLAELPEVEELFVFPHMGDGGLALGAALARASAEQGHPPSSAARLDNLRLGPVKRSTPFGIRGAPSDASGLRHARPECIVGPRRRRTARARRDRPVVSRLHGVRSTGPRWTEHSWRGPIGPSCAIGLNATLKRRVWYQPFCPSILDDEADSSARARRGAPTDS